MHPGIGTLHNSQILGDFTYFDAMQAMHTVEDVQLVHPEVKVLQGLQIDVILSKK